MFITGGKKHPVLKTYNNRLSTFYLLKHLGICSDAEYRRFLHFIMYLPVYIDLWQNKHHIYNITALSNWLN